MSEAAAGAANGYRKGFYKVGEVCAMTGLEGHVLRYWENEVPALRPRKSRGGQRLYRPEDIEVILRIKAMLYDEGYTIAGANRRLAQERPSEGAPDPLDQLESVRAEIRAILTVLEANETL